MPQKTQGLGDWFKASFDSKKFCSDPRLKVGIESIAAALKDAASAPLNIDDTIIDNTIKGIEAWLDSLGKSSPSGPLVVGKIYTQTDAQAFIASLPGTIPSNCSAKLLQYPQIVEALESLSPAKRLKAAGNETLIDRLIQILLDWGPMFLKIAMLLLPFFI